MTSIIAMLPDKSSLSIHAAVMSCVARCSDSDSPLVSLSDFLEQLRGLGWSDHDVNAVETTVLPLLGELHSGDTVYTGTDKVSPQ